LYIIYIFFSYIYGQLKAFFFFLLKKIVYFIPIQKDRACCFKTTTSHIHIKNLFYPKTLSPAITCLSAALASLPPAMCSRISIICLHDKSVSFATFIFKTPLCPPLVHACLYLLQFHSLAFTAFNLLLVSLHPLKQINYNFSKILGRGTYVR
jgi:hypothetical protein